MILIEFESTLMTFNEKSDQQIAIENFQKANEYAKLLNQGQPFTEESLREFMKQCLDVFWVFSNLRKDMAYNIHIAGETLNRNFSCKLEYDKEKKLYFSSCPAILLHYDFGFSLRALAEYKCSVCGKPVLDLDCDHITGDFYDDVECRTEDGLCNICGKENCQVHIPGKKYNHVQAFQIAYNVELITFDLVRDPEMKFARVTKVYYSDDMIKQGMTDDEFENFNYGVSELYCNHCSTCKGYQENLFDSLFLRDKTT